MFPELDLLLRPLSAAAADAYAQLVARLAAAGDGTEIDAAAAIKILGAAGKTIGDLQRDIARHATGAK